MTFSPAFQDSATPKPLAFDRARRSGLSEKMLRSHR
jgi:hypothetical protein